MLASRAEQLLQPHAAFHSNHCFPRGRTRALRSPHLAVYAAAADPGDRSGSDSSARQSNVAKLKASAAFQRLVGGSWRDAYKSETAPDADRQVEASSSAPSEDAAAGQEQAASTHGQTNRPSPPPSAAPHGRTSLGLGQGSVPWPETKQSQPAPAADSKPVQTVQRRKGEIGGPKPRFGGGLARPMTRVRFWINWHVEYGQSIRVVGSHENLGSWQLVDALELSWSEGDQWTAVTELPAGRIVEYKYVLVDGSTSQSLAWQQGNNSVLALRQDDREVEVYDNWAGGPGAAVIAAGKSSTREGRLVAWAEDIEQLVASQRGELRRSRMELIAAQDDARAAREETRRLKAELAFVEADRHKGKMRVRELETMNRLLRTQLQDSAASFRAALETAQRYLQEAEQQGGKQREVPQLEPSTVAADADALGSHAQAASPDTDADHPSLASHPSPLDDSPLTDELLASSSSAGGGAAAQLDKESDASAGGNNGVPRNGAAAAVGPVLEPDSDKSDLAGARVAKSRKQRGA